MKKPLLLLVEDSKEMQKTLEDIFGRLGCSTEAALSAEAALEGLKKGLKPDLIILDFKLPKMSGPQLFRRLAADARWKSIPVVPFSSYGGDSGDNAFLADWQAVAGSLGKTDGALMAVKKEEGSELVVPEQLLLTVANVLKSSIGLPVPYENAINELVDLVMGHLSRKGKSPDK